MAPATVAAVCMFGLVGGIAKAQAFVPVYLFGLILAVAVIAMYAGSVLFRTIRWLVTTICRPPRRPLQ